MVRLDEMGWPIYEPQPVLNAWDARAPKPEPTPTSPSYYSRWAIEPLEFCTKNDLPFWLGNIIKYGMRYDQKDGLADLKKARVYLDTKIKQLEGELTIYDKHRSIRADQPR